MAHPIPVQTSTIRISLPTYVIWAIPSNFKSSPLSCTALQSPTSTLWSCVKASNLFNYHQSPSRRGGISLADCILPCSFPPGDDLEIHWIKPTPTYTEVHSYYDNKDQLEDQHQRFRGRTSLFQDQISKGNASLQLTGVMVQDEGRYKCYTSTDGTIIYIERIYITIICSSDGIYPEPDLSWSISPPSSRTFQNTTRVQKTEELLSNISSSLTLSDREDDLDYICTISTPSNQRRASWRRGRECSRDIQSNSTDVAFWPHSEKVLVQIPAVYFCVDFACSPHACVGFLQTLWFSFHCPETCFIGYLVILRCH
uniref:Ig-like domain-containing protein n=1 Tax=Oryzias latipes TaxID=8090 RepID=A0A3P9KW40_ORYLA